jgi:diguanylate cyclase (GGDEF)-like protein
MNAPRAHIRGASIPDANSAPRSSNANAVVRARIRPVHILAGIVSLAGAAVLAAALGRSAGRHSPVGGLGAFDSLDVWLMTAGVVVGELLPLKIPRRGNDEEITFSTTFSFALLLSVGLVPAAVAQGSASVIQDLVARKPVWRITFNVGQYTLSLAAAALVLRLIGFSPSFGVGALSAGDLPAILLAMPVFFVVNVGIVGVVISLYQQIGVREYFRGDIVFSAATGAILLSLSPIVVAALDSSPVVFPLFALPLLGVYRGGRQAARSEHQANHDALTGLTNRTLFGALVTDALRRAPDRGPLAVLLMDLNRFKEVNDTLGHRSGDLLLQQVGRRLQHPLREGDVVARLGGDEFAILLSDLPHRDAAESIAERLHQTLEGAFTIDGYTLEVDASIGVARYPEDGADVDTLLQRADVAMYRAKENHVPYLTYSAEHDHHTPARLALVSDLHRAVDGEELVLWYQPQVDLERDELAGVEGLVRWRHPTLGLLQPDAFIEMAEHTGLIKPLTLRVLDEALRQCHLWLDGGLDLRVAINLSARALLDPRLPEEVELLLRKWSLGPESLKLEITESSLMADPAMALLVTRELSAQGIALAIDDFGTGYSSLAYLKELPVREIKIDKSFVINMATSRSDAVIVRSTVDLGHNLGLDVVAEGVEDERSLAELRALGCNLAQGYYLSPPVPPDQLVRWIAGRNDAPTVTGRPIPLHAVAADGGDALRATGGAV